MHRKQLLSLLETYLSEYSEEKECIDRLATFVHHFEDCFERSLPIGHVTGSAWIVNEASTHTLLTHHKKLDKWLQPGGHADGESDVLAVAIREAVEESGLVRLEPVDSHIFDVDIHLIPERGKEREHFHYDVRFALQTLGDDSFVVSDESHDLAWVEVAKLNAYTQEVSMLRMAQKWLVRQNG